MAMRKVTILGLLLSCKTSGRVASYRDVVFSEPLPGIISNNRNTALLSNHFDCAAAAGFLLGHCVKAQYLFCEGCPMFEVVAAFFVVLSVGVFVAHALDAYRSL
jgi:hypothetical protein